MDVSIKTVGMRAFRRINSMLVIGVVNTRKNWVESPPNTLKKMLVPRVIPSLKTVHFNPSKFTSKNGSW